MSRAVNHVPSEPVDESGADRDPVEELAEEFLERRRQGAEVTVTEYEQKYPHWSQRIRELFSTLLLVEEMKTVRRQSTSHTSGNRPPSLADDDVTQLGDFQIVREIGRGGMGVVYEAVQESLGRRVALKVVSSRSVASMKALERFRREAQAAARLHHTNIVPVFGVGEEDGRHYYVMQYIEGDSLDCILDELTAGSQLTTAGPRHNGGDAIDREGEAPAEPPSSLRLGGSLALPTGQNSDQSSLGLRPEAVGTESRPTKVERRNATQAAPHGEVPTSLGVNGTYWYNVANIGAQAADALQYAHEAGVLHRDIKPGNLLLDQKGIVWVTDFGLAKVVEQEDVTRTGDVVGTLRYMAPEQMDRQADRRCDIYALGLTLYELATRRPAFDETSRHRLMKQVFQHDPPPPRTIDPKIPRDLETVILKAVAREPDHRYQTAGAMRDDLHRFLQDQPVSARRIRAIERLWRWCRRNPVTAGLTSAVFALLVGITIVAFLGAVRVGRALDGETRQRQRAETTSELAFQVLDKIYAQLAPDRVTDDSPQVLSDSDGGQVELPHQPVVSQETAALLENLLEFYDRLAEQAGDDPQLLRRVADANRRVGDIQSRLGHHAQARDALLRSVALYQELESQSPDQGQVTFELARAYNELGRVCAAIRQIDESQAAHRDALSLLELAATDSRLDSHQFELARTHYFLGLRHGPTRKVTGTAPSSQNSEPREEAAREGQGPPNPGRRGFRGASPVGRPPGPGTQFDWTDRQRHLQRAVDLLEELLEHSPSAPEYRRLLAQCLKAMAGTSFAPRRDRNSSPQLKKATEILEQLVVDFPDVADYRYELCQIYAMPGFWLGGGPGATRGASGERLKRALEMSGQLVAEYPHVPDYATLRTQVLSQHAESMKWVGRRDLVEASFREAVDVQSALVERFPEVARFKLSLVHVQKSLADVLRGQQKLAEARSLLEQSVTTLGELLEHDSAAPFARMSISAHYAALADVLDDLGEDEAAAEAKSQAAKFRGHAPFGPRPAITNPAVPNAIPSESSRDGEAEQSTLHFQTRGAALWFCSRRRRRNDVVQDQEHQCRPIHGRHHVG